MPDSDGAMALQRNDLKKLQELNQLLEEKVIERTQQLMCAKRTWQATFDAFADPLSIVDKDFTIVRTNLAHASYGGQDIRLMAGQKCHQTLFGRSEQCTNCPVSSTLNTGEVAEGEIVDSSRGRIFRMWSVPMQSNEDAEPGCNPDWAVCHYKDVTEEKALQQKVMQSEKMAAIGTLAGGVAHEINNPLGAILAFTQLGLVEASPDTAVHDFLKEIEESAHRCKRIVADLLDFSRQSKGERRAVDLQEVCERVVFLCKTQYDHHNVSLVTEYGSNVPLVLADRHQLQQVLINLVSNAYGALCEPGTIRVATHIEPGVAVIMAVSDDGPGIDELTQSKLFEPFFTTKPEGEGTGLGLAVSYGIVEEHGGTIEVSSKEGHGSTFEVRLPWPVEELTVND